MQPLEDLLHVGREVERIGDHDDIEPLAELERLGRLHVELAVRGVSPGGLDLALRKVDPDFPPCAEPAEELTRAAAHLKDGGIG